MRAYLEDDVSLLEVSVFCGQPGAGHLLDEDLAPQAKAVLCKRTLLSAGARTCCRPPDHILDTSGSRLRSGELAWTTRPGHVKACLLLS